MTTDTLPASAWVGADLAPLEDQWIHRFTPKEIAELEACHAGLRGRDTAGFEALTQRDFPLPTLGPVLARQGREIESGRGFAFLRGLPVERWGVEMSRAMYWGISCHLGVPVRQNARAHRLVKVTDVGVPQEKATARGPYGRGELHFHSDFADVVGLLCLRVAQSGGISRICSSRSILARMQQEHPEYIAVFERGFRFYRKGEEAVGEPPVSARRLPMLQWREGEEPLFLFWPSFAKQGAQFSGEALTPLEAAALAYVDDMAHDARMCLDTRFQPGDLQYLNNYKVLHSRTHFEDWPEPARKRYLERVWMRTREGRRFPPGFADLHGPNSLVDGFPVVPPAVVAAREIEQTASGRGPV